MTPTATTPASRPRRRTCLPLLRARRHQPALHRRGRSLHQPDSWPRSRPASSSTTCQFGDFHPLPGWRDAADRRLEPVHRRRQPAHRRRASEPEVRHLRRAAGAMRRVAAIIGLVAVGALVVLGPAAGDDGGTYEVRAIFDNGDFLVPGRGGPGRRRQGRLGVLGRRHDARRVGEPFLPGAATVERMREPRQGGGGDEDHRPRLPGLPPGRLLPDPARVAARREVHRLPADPAPGPRLRAAAAAGRDPRRPAREPASTSCRSRTTARRSTSTWSTTSCGEPYAERFRLILNELGRRARGPGEDLDAIIQARRPGAAPDRPGARRAREPEPAARPARQGLRHDPHPARPRAPPIWPGSSTTPTPPPRRPQSAARTSRRGSRSSRRRFTSCA